MKRNVLVLVEVIFMLFLTSFSVMAQEWKNTNPKMNKLLADAPYLVATEVTLEPGERSDIRSYSAYFFYALTPGKLLVHYKDGVDDLYEMKAGEYVASEPERPHETENVGEKTLKFLLVELKEHPYKAIKKNNNNKTIVNVDR